MPSLGGIQVYGGGIGSSRGIPVMQPGPTPLAPAAPPGLPPAAALSGFATGGSTGSSSGTQSSSNRSSSESFVQPELYGMYQDLLRLNQQNYGRVLQSYQAGQDVLRQGFPDIYQGIQGVRQSVRRDLGVGGGGWGVAQPGANAIQEAYAQRVGANDQQLINAGLGNTTIRANAQNQALLNTQRAYGELGANLANTAAGYEAQLGMAGEQARIGNLGQIAQLYGNQGNVLAGYSFGNTAGNVQGQRSESSGSSSGVNTSVNQNAGPGFEQAYGYGGRRPGGTLGGPGSYGGASVLPGGGGGSTGHIPWAAGMGGPNPQSAIGRGYGMYGGVGGFDPLSFGAPGLGQPAGQAPRPGQVVRTIDGQVVTVGGGDVGGLAGNYFDFAPGDAFGGGDFFLGG